MELLYFIGFFTVIGLVMLLWALYQLWESSDNSVETVH